MAHAHRLSPCAKCQDEPRAPSHAYCRSCRNGYQNEYRRRRYRSEPDYRRKSRAAGRKALYGITEDEYAELWAQQGGVCAICLLDDNKRELHVDHDHETGEVRGLLCANCNGALGMFREKPSLMERAIAYVA
jgi:hypothetical protein